jgi:Tol biopolymer transport system component
VSDNGSLIFVPGPASSSPVGAEWNLALIDRKGVVEPLKLPPSSYSHPRVSPDGTRIAFATTDPKETFVSVYDLAGGTAPRRLTFGGNNQFPVWSRDGTRITFRSDRDGDLAIFWQLADGTGVAERLTKPDRGAMHVPSSWSPKDETLLFSSATGGAAALRTFTLASRKEAPFGGVEASTVIGAVFSPDGRWVAYSGDTSDSRSTVYVQPFPATGAKYQLPVNGTSPHHQLWSPDGKELFYNPRAGAFEAVAVTTQPAFALGNPIAVPRPFEMSGPGTPRDFDITPGGKFVGLVSPEQSTAATPEAPQIQVVVNWFEELKARVPTK